MTYKRQFLRWSRAIVISLALTAAVRTGRGSKAEKGSPDEALDHYFRMINDGVLLTPEGWKKAAELFVRESPAPNDDVIFVTTKFPLGNGPMDVNGSQAAAYEKWVDDIGTIDSAFRYHPPPKHRLEVEGVIRTYRLVLTERHWEIGADGLSEHEVTGPPEWRIEGSLSVRSASREAAIRYVIERRDKMTDLAIRNNADRTIAILKRLPTPRTHI